MGVFAGRRRLGCEGHAKLVDVRDHGVVLCENGEDNGGGAGGEVVEKAGCERPEEKGQKGRREDACEEVRNNEEGLRKRVSKRAI